ncbi:hypothetical protein DACRYDRAFT_107543 [Dacryopinax primogenitus]|uniref:Uncharacterized protein n=1 Tax=Dacryopinax primogenitus (strain DJM 731) TaxID=1858805 RepID=M5G0Y8_DACPD|nr:uncharacterized protein DACRYDRAFT_107543 [Dacryopinax primogenitus]EJU01810.1 hypothetical protein DACRYDRAFT_107543 [Dacryopinax primogenitus]
MSTKKRRRSEVVDPELEMSTNRVCRITYHVDERVFDRVFNEDSLDDMRAVILKKLGLPDAQLGLSQLRDDTEVDLEDDDDFTSLKAQAQVDNRIDVLVTVLDAPVDWSFSRSATPAPDVPFEQGRSVEPVAATRRRSLSFGNQSRPSLPAVANLMRAKNLIPHGAAGFDDDDDNADEEREEPTLGERANRAKKRISMGLQDVSRAAVQVTAMIQDTAKKPVPSGKNITRPTKSTANAAKDNSLVQEAETSMTSLVHTAVQAGQTAATAVKELGRKAANTVADATTATKRAIQPVEEEPPAKRRKKKHNPQDTDTPAQDAVRPVEPPTKEKLKARKRKNDLPVPLENTPTEPPPKEPAPIGDGPQPKEKRKRKKKLSEPAEATAPTPITLAPRPEGAASGADVSSLDPVARILAREAMRKKQQEDKQAEQDKKKAEKSAGSDAKPSEKKKPKGVEKTGGAQPNQEGESDQTPLTSTEPVNGVALDGVVAHAEPAITGAAGGRKDKKKRAKKSNADFTGAEPPVDDAAHQTVPEQELKKPNKKKKDASQEQPPNSPANNSVRSPDQPQSNESRIDAVVHVRPKRKQGARAERIEAAQKKIIPSIEPHSKEREVDEGEVHVEVHGNNHEAPINTTTLTDTPRPSPFLERLVQTSTPTQHTPIPRRSPINCLGFPAQLLRLNPVASGTPTSASGRFQTALARAAMSIGDEAVPDDITNFSQPLSNSQPSVPRILETPCTSTSKGKLMRPLSQLPRPSLTKTPGWNSGSSSPTGPPVPSPAAVVAPASKVRDPRHAPTSPSLGARTPPPPVSSLPTWTHLPQDPSPATESSASLVDQLRSSSAALGEEISRPDSTVTRDEEMEVELATQGERFDFLDRLDVQMEDSTTSSRTKADDDANDTDDEDLTAPRVISSNVLAPPAPIIGSVNQESRRPSQEQQRRGSQQSKPKSDSSLVSYPSIPTPKAASQPLFRPDTQLPSQFQSLPASSQEDTGVFGLASQYIGLSQLSKDKLRQSMSQNSATNTRRATSTPKLNVKPKELESETDEEDDEEDDSDVEQSILPRDRLAGAKKAGKGRAAAKFF